MPFFDPRPRRRHHDGHKPDTLPSRHDTAVATQRSGTREIKVVRRVLDANDAQAARNRELFAAKGIFTLNLMSSPGSGKTTLLEKSLARLMSNLRCAVIVGDICTTQDADRLAASGAPVVQINTDAFGGECHLAAHVIEKALSAIDLDAVDLLIVENIGNLVCPAEFDIGEDRRVVVLSVTEGEDKPAKYPLMFRECDAMLLNKIDLLPYLEYDTDLVLRSIEQIHPGMPVFQLSAKTGQGLDPWLAWIVRQIDTKKVGAPHAPHHH
ncbi:hydrogenase nickel incorporation protein HypB [Desulfatitalea alkaliphila]|uniref:Hydrogenase nickel incorporation protein HypB n=1 Tax=Desulfatitalea alkaliphila TaxID=2929485 RepID=A0AA41US95_9BACT|nr:hydrogenase nickel incorporation protein HypB [Desulfatitalea alkaliphila]MCJ8503068.1 hydrogenase nickel incorporation protein HypB [Desulfatitalea alkaliphila]